MQRKWLRYPPASSETVQAFVRKIGVDFPHDYLAFLRHSNGGEGSLSIAPGWFMVYSVESTLQVQKELEIASYLPGYFIFGSNGGGELLVFNTHEKQPWKVYYVPAIGMEETNVRVCARDFRAFIKAIGRTQNRKWQ